MFCTETGEADTTPPKANTHRELNVMINIFMLQLFGAYFAKGQKRRVAVVAVGSWNSRLVDGPVPVVWNSPVVARRILSGSHH